MCKLRINIMCKLTNAARDVWFQIALHNSLWNYRFIFYLHWLRFENNCPQTKLRINFYIAANEANKQSKRRPKNWQCKKHWPIRIVLLVWGINFICKSHSRTKQKKCIKSIAIIRANAYLIIFGDTNRLFYLLCAWIDHAAKVRRSKNHQPKMFCRFLSWNEMAKFQHFKRF